MPRNVRNFWLKADIDGRKATLAGGPQRENGGFTLTIHRRNGGDVDQALVVSGYVNDRGEICLDVYDDHRRLVYTTTSVR